MFELCSFKNIEKALVYLTEQHCISKVGNIYFFDNGRVKLEEGNENWYVGEFLEGNEGIEDTLNIGSSFFGNWEDDGIEEDLKTFLKRMEKFTK